MKAERPEAMLATAPAASIPNAPDEVTGEPAYRKAACYVWALLPVRIHEVLALVGPKCGGDMRIIAFINDATVIC